MIFELLLFLRFSIVLSSREKLHNDPTVIALPEYGTLRGIRKRHGVFFGNIPYAAPPVGSLRFAAPEPPTPWTPAVLDATEYGYDCWQIVDPVMNPSVNRMSEDCLTLAIHAPILQARKYPVLVWLHGGAFQQGGAHRPEYDASRLQNVVVVTLNYRLGALGFLVSKSDGVRGNFGLQDQRAALRWVRANIQYFGGDPDNITLFGESAGAVMTVLHCMMDDAGKLFHKAIVQSNPLGLQFRSVVVADFIGQALKHAVDCRDLACLRNERVEEILRAQSSLMGVPRSVGDFFTWGPTLTTDDIFRSSSTSPLRNTELFKDLDSLQYQRSRESAWAAVNVSQPLLNLDKIPSNIPIVIGTNKNEGEMFVHGAFPLCMSKAVYWMFVGALFRDSASRVLQHYRPYVQQIEEEASAQSAAQVKEAENRLYVMEHGEELEREYQLLLDLNESIAFGTGMDGMVDIQDVLANRGGSTEDEVSRRQESWYNKLWPFNKNLTEAEAMQVEQRRKERRKERVLKEAAKVAVDYRPVMSRIIDDYLFRCPSWHFAHILSRDRLRQGQANNVYVYQFSHSTHIPGFKECWGKSCHTAELPYVFQAMEVIRSHYSTLSRYAQDEAPQPPEYPFTELLKAYEDAANTQAPEPNSGLESIGNHSTADLGAGFQTILNRFFGDYFKADTDEEIASDMADRWIAFASTGDPNYEESQTLWRPWRYVADQRGAQRILSLNQRDFRKMRFPRSDSLDDIFDLNAIDESETDNATALVEGYVWSQSPDERIYRRRILKALGMETASEDMFQTMLRRVESSTPTEYNLGSLMQPGRRSDKTLSKRKALQELQQFAQEIRIMGTGLSRESGRRRRSSSGEDEFFPQILDLKWPPEDLLVERDCTCDMWDRIRCKSGLVCIELFLT